MKLSIAIAIAGMLGGCATYNAALNEYENAVSSPEFRTVKQACASGDLSACQTVVETRAANRQSSSRVMNGTASSYTANRNRDMIMQHGAGGCTPNFSTGGCL